MAKIMDITDKLSFDENPKMIIKGKEIEVNADAPTMLKVMALMGSDKPEVSSVIQAYEMMFPEKSRKIIDGFKLTFVDLMIVIEAGVALITGETDNTEQ